MKRHVQFEGVRKWAGDHLLELQQEPLKVTDRFFGQHGAYILQGCQTTENGNLYDIAPGLVVMEGLDRTDTKTVMVVPFAGAQGVPLPLYLTLVWSARQGEYANGIQPIAYDYYAEASTIEPAEGEPHLILNNDTPRFVDAIQDDTHSFITEAERARWNNLLPTLMQYMDELFRAYDPTPIGEMRQFAAGQAFDNEDYLLCDGSAIDWDDYPRLNLPVKAIVNVMSSGVGDIRSWGWNGSLWVVVGRSPDSGQASTLGITTSPDGAQWTIRVNRNESVGVGGLGGFTKHVDGMWVVGISQGGAADQTQYPSLLYQSADGLSWEYTGLPYARLDDITKVGDTWLMLARNGGSSVLLLSSRDLITWTQVQSLSSTNSSDTQRSASHIAHHDGRTIAITLTTAYRSDNATMWSEITLPSLESREELSDIGYSAGKWIIVTSGAICWSRRIMGTPGPGKPPCREHPSTASRLAPKPGLWLVDKASSQPARARARYRRTTARVGLSTPALVPTRCNTSEMMSMRY